VRDQGAVTVVRAGHLELALARVVGARLDGAFHLTGRVADTGGPHVLAGLTLLGAGC
jgi:hypothetical protein